MSHIDSSRSKRAVAKFQGSSASVIFSSYRIQWIQQPCRETWFWLLAFATIVFKSLPTGQDQLRIRTWLDCKTTSFVLLLNSRFTTTDLPSTHKTTVTEPICQSHVPFYQNKIPRYLNSIRTEPPHSPERSNLLFSKSTRALHLDLILIPTASHSASNQVCWGCWRDKARTMTSSANSRDVISSPEYQASLQPPLCFGFPFKKIANSTGEKTHPWQEANSKPFTFLPSMWTWLSLHL